MEVYDVIIIGGGPSGMTAALYLLRGGKRVLLVEKTVLGGQTNNAGVIENYPSVVGKTGFELSYELSKQCKEAGLEIKYGTATSVDLNSKVKTLKVSDQEVSARNVIIACGATPKKLRLEHEEEYIGKGISFCAHCDGYFFKDKTVAVVGGGDTALTDALYLSGICEKVYLIHRRDSFRGTQKYVDELKNRDNVVFVLSSTVTGFEGEETLQSVTVKTNEGEKKLGVSALFEAVGIIPSSDDFDVKKDDYGFIIVDKNKMTSVHGVYAVGDITDSPLRQIVTACADGAIAANAIETNLN